MGGFYVGINIITSNWLRFMIIYSRGRRLRPPAGGPGRGSGVPPALHSLPLPFEAILLKATQKPPEWVAFVLAGEEGFEPSAYGFGDRRSTS